MVTKFSLILIGLKSLSLLPIYFSDPHTKFTFSLFIFDVDISLLLYYIFKLKSLEEVQANLSDGEIIS